MAPILPREAGRGTTRSVVEGAMGGGARPLPALRRRPTHAPTNQTGRIAMSEGVMNKVRLGRTDLMVTSIGFGTSGLGDMPDTYGYGVDADRAKATVLAIFGGPTNLIDTSRIYGMGRSEERIGAVIRERGGLPPGFVVSTKLDRDPEGQSLRRRPGPPLARAEPQGAGARARRPSASARSRACPLVQGSDRARRRARRALPDQGGGAGEGGRSRRRPGDR